MNSVNRIANQQGIAGSDARRYNVLDALPDGLDDFDYFYTNPPWGQYNNGRSVGLFVQRGIEAISRRGEGLIVIADDPDIPWPSRVLAQVQRDAAEHGFFVGRMQPHIHLYHLDDAPDLKSCNLVIRSLPDNEASRTSENIEDKDRLKDFYGRSKEPRVRYIRDLQPMDYNKANDAGYGFEGWGDER